MRCTCCGGNTFGTRMISAVMGEVLNSYLVETCVSCGSWRTDLVVVKKIPDGSGPAREPGIGRGRGARV